MKTILLSLNEVNFNFIEFYSKEGLLPNFSKFLNTQKLVKTNSEKEFKNQEPWIQWVSLHTGKILSDIRTTRNKLEHNYEYPKVEEVEDSIDIAKMFIDLIQAKRISSFSRITKTTFTDLQLAIKYLLIKRLLANKELLMWGRMNFCTLYLTS